MVVKHIRSPLAIEFMNESQKKACAYKSQAATNRKTRDYHRFPHDGKPGRCRMNAEPFESSQKNKPDFQATLMDSWRVGRKLSTDLRYLPVFLTAMTENEAKKKFDLVFLSPYDLQRLFGATGMAW